MHRSGSRQSRPGSIVVAIPTAAEKKAFASACDGDAQTQPDNRRLSIIQTGIGAAAVKRVLAEHLDGASGLVSLGTAGALAPDLEAGQMIVPRSIQTMGGDVFTADAAWHERALGALREGMSVRTDTLLHTDEIVADVETKRKLYQESGAVAIDMESGAVAKLAAESAIPFLAVRVILDPASHGIPSAASAAVDTRGDLNVPALIGKLLSRPGQLAGVIRMGLEFARAAETLRQTARSGAVALVE